MAETTAPNYDEDVSKKSSTGLDPKVANLLAYLFSWVGGLIIWLLEKENKFVKWNALQALILGIIEFGSFIVMFFFWLGYLIAGVAWIFAIICIVMGFQGKTFRIPGISKLTDKYFKM